MRTSIEAIKTLVVERIYPWVRTTGLSLLGWFFIVISIVGFAASIANHGLEPFRNREPLPRWLIGPLGVLFGVFFLALRKHWKNRRVVLALVIVFVTVSLVYALLEWLLIGRHITIL